MTRKELLLYGGVGGGLALLAVVVLKRPQAAPQVAFLTAAIPSYHPTFGPDPRTAAPLNFGTDIATLLQSIPARAGHDSGVVPVAPYIPPPLDFHVSSPTPSGGTLPAGASGGGAFDFGMGNEMVMPPDIALGGFQGLRGGDAGGVGGGNQNAGSVGAAAAAGSRGSIIGGSVISRGAGFLGMGPAGMVAGLVGWLAQKGWLGPSFGPADPNAAPSAFNDADTPNTSGTTSSFSGSGISDAAASSGGRDPTGSGTGTGGTGAGSDSTGGGLGGTGAAGGLT